MRKESIVAYFEAASQHFSKMLVFSTDALHFFIQLYAVLHRDFGKSVSLRFVTEADPCVSVAQNVDKRGLCFV
jgi:hypothetical protein